MDDSLNLQKTIEDAVNETYDERLSGEQRQKVAHSLTTWLRDYARKRPIKDLPERLDRFQSDIEKMAKGMDLVMARGKLVVKVDGSDEDTLRRLRIGTEWFEGNDKIMDWVMAGVADDSPVVKSK